MTIRGRITTAFPVPAIRLRTLVRSRTAAVVTILAINLLGISAPIVAHAAVVYPLCTAASPVPEVSPNGCLFGPPFPGFEMVSAGVYMRVPIGPKYPRLLSTPLRCVDVGTKCLASGTLPCGILSS